MQNDTQNGVLQDGQTKYILYLIETKQKIIIILQFMNM